jgi:hypothetical protein
VLTYVHITTWKCHSFVDFFKFVVPTNIFKLYSSVSKPMNIKSYSSVWARHNEYMSRPIWLWPTHIFVGWATSLTNICDIYSSVAWLHRWIYEAQDCRYRRDLEIGVSFFSLPRVSFISFARPAPPLCKTRCCLHLRLRSPCRRVESSSPSHVATTAARRHRQWVLFLN